MFRNSSGSIEDTGSLDATSNQKHAIVFVHGLGGSAKKTWRKMLAVFEKDPTFADCTFDFYDYPTRLINLPFLAPPPGLLEIAEGLGTFLGDRFQNYSRIDLVGHSLGGVIVRQFVIANARKHAPLPITRVALIAAPNSGSSLASLGHQINFRHQQLKSLAKDSDALLKLQEAWHDAGIEAKIAVHYILAGKDRCVSRESACVDPSVIPSMLIKADHRSIIDPKGAADSRYTILAKFLRQPSKAEAVRIRASDPLFEIYSPEQEKYFVEREPDQRLATSISTGNVWLFGASGVGKSAALRRAVHRNGWTFFQLNLAPYEDASPLGMLLAIANELAVLAINRPATFTNRTLEEGCASIRTSLNIMCKEQICAIVVEEIPLTADQMPDFMELLSKLSQVINSAEQLENRTVFAFSSLIDFSTHTIDLSAKIRENIQMIPALAWTSDDIERLVRMLAKELRRDLSENEVSSVVVSAAGLPRFVKLLFRHYRNGVAEGQTLQQMLQRVRSELL